MDNMEKHLSVKELENRKKSDVFFFTSTKKGLGHLSRAMAIYEKLSRASFAATIGAYDTTRDYVRGVDAEAEIQLIEYDFSPTSLPENFHDESLYVSFVEKNFNWLQSLTDTSIVITDFVASSIFIRRFLLEKNIINCQIIGVYHSFIEKNDDLDASILHWQKAVHTVVDSLDICFVSRLEAGHSFPHITKQGTLIVTTDPVVHERKKTNEQVKAELGLRDSDEYILIQAGMRGNGSLSKFVQSIDVESEYQYVLLGWQLDDSSREALKDHPRVKILEGVSNGHELVGAAKGVIAKPGMQTLAEAIVYNVPILLLPDEHPERKLKIQMLRNVVKDTSIPCVIDESLPYETQIDHWLQVAEKQVAFFEGIHGNGAQQIADFLESIHLEEHLARLSESEKPHPITDTPPGKTDERLNPKVSSEIVARIRGEITRRICNPLSQAGIKNTFVLFGGVAKERLRPDSDVDALLVIEEENLELLAKHWDITLLEPLSEQRIQTLRDGTFDALRLKARTSSGMDLNISLMTDTSYKKIFSSYVSFFKEELGKKISGTPYHVSDFRGGIHALPKVIKRVINGELISERRSPGVIKRENDVTIFGVKHRMLLTAENLSDDFDFGDPTRKLIRSMTRAVLYWNNLYLKENNQIIGISPEAFDVNFFFRLLRDPLDMVGPKIQRKIKNLYFNELRRLRVIYERRLLSKTNDIKFSL